MARSFARPASAPRIEDFAHGTLAHLPSGDRFEMTWRGDRLLFRREQRDAAGRPINVWEHEVDWILGSGNHARTYLYRTEGGELYQLPIAWYTQEKKWGMAPGFDRPDHEGVLRRVRRECMFCHNAYPDSPLGSDLHDAPQNFPEKLPEGIGCQRCHGPGAEHVRRAFSVGKEPRGAAIRAAIIDPGALPKARMEDVCFECHLQPSVALQGLRRYGVGDWSFRPGQDLAQYQVAVDIDEEGVAPGDRFEINHQAYRLRQSRCYLTSADLSCLTCHDPHTKVAEAERAEHYASACLGCHEGHTPEACGFTGGRSKVNPEIPFADCVACHMPKRRPSDVVHTVMTDHMIQIPKAGVDYLAPRTEGDPVLTDLRLLEPERIPEALREVYRAGTVVRAVRSSAALNRLETLLAKSPTKEIDPYVDLAEGQLGARRFAAAEKTLRGILARSPGRPLALEWLGIALAAQGKREEGIATLKAGVAATETSGGSARPESAFNLGLLRFGSDPKLALTDLEQAIALRPNQVAAWYYRGLALESLDRRSDAEAAYQRTLEIDPRFTRAYLALGKSALARGDRTAARRWLAHGAKVAADRAKVKAALDALPDGQ